MSPKVSRASSAPPIFAVRAAPRPEPIYFGPEGRARAGWLHRAARPSASGVVICNPFGFEAICAHRTLRRLASSLADAGASTLRFDYDGTGDSAGDDRDADRLDAWIESTRDAAKAMRELCGVDRVWLVGLRLGALVATLAAVGERHIAGLVAIAPVVVGRTYLRELSVLQTTLELDGPPDGTAGSAASDGGQEALGFAITPETRKALTEINLAKLSTALGGGDGPAFQVLALDREDLPTADKWIAHLAEQGIEAESRRVAGYLEMMVDPHKSVVPVRILGEVTEWLSRRTNTDELQCGSASAESSWSFVDSVQRGWTPSTSVRRNGSPVRVEARREADFDGVLETPLFVDDDRLLFAILSRSKTAPPSGRSVILLNAGSIHHIGPNRLYVRLARAWAAAGHEVLRLDITGIGDSSLRSGQEANVVYSRHALEDVVAAVALCRRRGARDVRPVGLCSGAYFAMKSAAATEQVSGFVAINPLTFDKPPPGPTDYPRARVVREAARYRDAIRDVEKWKKLFRGRVRLKAAATMMAGYVARRVIKQARDVSRWLNVPWKDDVGAELVRLARNNVEQRFVFASSDPGNELLHDEAGSVMKALKRDGMLRIEILQGADHTFTSLWSHGPLVDALTAAITPGTLPTPEERHVAE